MKQINSLFICNLFILFCIINVGSSETINCISCKTDEKYCTVDPLNKEKIKFIECDDGEKNICYTKLDKDGHNERGCIKEDKCVNNENCFTCNKNENNCNNQIIPPLRPKCYICSGRNCDNPEERNLTAEFCEFYNTKDDGYCYTTSTKFNVIRGCVAGAKKEDINCGDQKDCKVNKCGKAPANIPCNTDIVTLENKCYSCNSKSDSSCAKEFTDEKYEECKEEKGCYERYKDGVASRGCAENLTEEELKACKDPKSEKCHHCDLPACNFHKINGSSTIIISNIILISSILINWKFF